MCVKSFIKLLLSPEGAAAILMNCHKCCHLSRLAEAEGYKPEKKINKRVRPGGKVAKSKVTRHL